MSAGGPGADSTSDLSPGQQYRIIASVTRKVFWKEEERMRTRRSPDRPDPQMERGLKCVAEVSDG